MNKLTELNGLSISDLELDQEGKLTVTFDLPVSQKSTHYAVSKQGTRVLDVYDHEDLERLAKQLFARVKKHVMEEPDEDMDSVNCDQCKEATCCREYNVLVTNEDIDQLRGELSRVDFAKKYTDPAVDWTGEFKFQLKSNQDKVGDKCVFLKRDRTGRMRCSVYEQRPQICRDFDMAVCDELDSLD